MVIAQKTNQRYIDSLATRTARLDASHQSFL
jgi:hypothetical protein